MICSSLLLVKSPLGRVENGFSDISKDSRLTSAEKSLKLEKRYYFYSIATLQVLALLRLKCFKNAITIFFRSMS